MAAVIVGFAAAAFAVIVYCGYRDKVSDRDDNFDEVVVRFESREQFDGKEADWKP